MSDGFKLWLKAFLCIPAACALFAWGLVWLVMTIRGVYAFRDLFFTRVTQ